MSRSRSRCSPRPGPCRPSRWPTWCCSATWPSSGRRRPERPPPDLRDIVGQSVGRRAVEVAAAGGHHLLFAGPPGSGKTMLAERLPGVLPALELDDALEVSAVHSVAGLLAADAPLIRRPPYQAP